MKNCRKSQQAPEELTEYQKLAILLLLSGYVSTQARLAGAVVDGARQGLFATPDRANEAFAELLRTVVDPERFPALHAALVGGAFAPMEGPSYAPFDLGLGLMLDVIDDLMKREAAAVAETTGEQG